MTETVKEKVLKSLIEDAIKIQEMPINTVSQLKRYEHKCLLFTGKVAKLRVIVDVKK